MKTTRAKSPQHRIVMMDKHLKARQSRTAQAVDNSPIGERDNTSTRGNKVVAFPRGNGAQTRQLTAKQARFAYLVGHEEMSFTGAYREVYNVEKMSPETIKRKAFTEAHKGNVTAAIRDYQEKKKLETPRDPERMKAVLVELMFDLASDKQQQAKDRLKAAELLGKTVGLFSDVVEHKGNITSDSEAMDALRKRIEALAPGKSVKP